MCDSIVIRPAVEGDCAFIVGLVSSLLEFGSPAWEDKDALAPGFSEVLTRAVRAQDLRSTVLIAELTDGTPLGFISLKVAADVTGVERGHVADLAVTDTARRLGVGRTLMNEGERGHAIEDWRCSALTCGQPTSELRRSTSGSVTAPSRCT